MVPSGPEALACPPARRPMSADGAAVERAIGGVRPAGLAEPWPAASRLAGEGPRDRRMEQGAEGADGKERAAEVARGEEPEQAEQDEGGLEGDGQDPPRVGTDRPHLARPPRRATSSRVIRIEGRWRRLYG